MRRSFLASVLSFMLAFTLSPVVFAEEQVTLHYFTWAGGVSATQIREDWIAPFEAANPHVKIEYEGVSWNEFWEKLPVYIATGNAPDIVHMSVGYVYDYAHQGLLENLQPYFDRDLNPDDFFMQPFNAMRYPDMETGDLYGIPYSFILNSLYYNKDMFDQAGVVYPDDTWTWETLQQVARRFARDINGDGVPELNGFVVNNSYYLYEPLVHAYGGSVLNEDYTRATLNSPEGVAALEFLVDMVYEDGSAMQGGLNLFTNQQVAMAIMTTVELPYERDMGLNFDVTLVPDGPRKRVVRLWPDSFAIPAASQHKDEAWEFIKFAITLNKMDRYSGERKIPVYKSLATSPEWLQPELMGNKMVFINSIAYGDPLEFRPAWGQWEPKLRQALAPALLGQMSPAEAVANANHAIQTELDRFFAE